MKGGGEKLMKRHFRRNRKAVSPVIATIIIVAIAIVMSIAVAYWLLGLGSSFTKYEKVEFVSAYADTSGANFVVHMDVKNTGSAAATLDPTYIMYNGKPATAYTQTPVPGFGQTTLEPGQSKTGLTINLPNVAGGNWTSGMTVEIMMHTTAGKDYPKVLTLP